MKNVQIVKTMVVAFACALSLVVAVGCSATSASSSASASASDSSSDSTVSASPESTEPSDESSDSTAEPSAESPSEESTSADPADSRDAAIETALSLGYQVFEGTVRVVDAEELVELQGVDIDPAMASGGGTYAVLVFDQATEVSGMGADGSGERSEIANVLGIAEYTDYGSFTVDYGDLDSWRPLDGQHVLLAAQARDITFPSDVRLPLGEPSASAAKVLE